MSPLKANMSFFFFFSKGDVQLPFVAFFPNQSDGSTIYMKRVLIKSKYETTKLGHFLGMASPNALHSQSNFYLFSKVLFLCSQATYITTETFYR